MNDKQPASHKANRFVFDDTPTFDQAEVPAYMLQLEVDSLPANRVFFLEPDETPTWNETPPMMVDKKSGKLHLVGSVEVDPKQEFPQTPLEKVAVMRVEAIGTDEQISSFFVADLRFIENHKLPVVDDLDDAPTDQEDFNTWMECKEDLREVVAFIAPIPNTEASKKGIIPATYYGALDDLRLRGDTLLKKSIKKHRQASKLAKAAAKEQVTADSEPAPVKPEPKELIPQVIFSHRN